MMVAHIETSREVVEVDQPRCSFGARLAALQSSTHFRVPCDSEVRLATSVLAALNSQVLWQLVASVERLGAGKARHATREASVEPRGTAHEGRMVMPLVEYHYGGKAP